MTSHVYVTWNEVHPLNLDSTQRWFTRTWIEILCEDCERSLKIKMDVNYTFYQRYFKGYPLRILCFGWFKFTHRSLSIPPEPVLKTWDSKCLALIAQIVREFGMNPKVGGFESPSGKDNFCLKNFDTCSRTSVCVSKMNAVARTQLTFQMLTLFQIYTFPNFNGCSIEVWEWISNFSPHKNRCNHLSMVVLKLNYVGERGPRHCSFPQSMITQFILWFTELEWLKMDYEEKFHQPSF